MHTLNTYTIKEIAELIDEEQHVLRYWEREFYQLQPKKNAAGNRVYSYKELLLLKNIKEFLRDDRLTIAETKHQLSTMNTEELYADKESKSHEHYSQESLDEQLASIIFSLNDIIHNLRR